VLWIVAALVAVHAAIGLVAGWLAWDVGRLLQARLGRASLAAASRQ
jgi:hypothetical protein